MKERTREREKVEGKGSFNFGSHSGYVFVPSCVCLQFRCHRGIAIVSWLRVRRMPEYDYCGGPRGVMTC